MENSNKRSREEFADSSPDEESKRLRPDFLIEILDDDEEEEEVDSGVDFLADVIKSLEDEISLPSPPAPSAEAPERSPQHDLGYLLEASDDELGLPPTVGSETPTSNAGDLVVVVDDEDADLAAFGRIWEFEDEMSGGYGGGFGFGEPLDIGFGYGFEGADSADYSGYEELWHSLCHGDE